MSWTWHGHTVSRVRTGWRLHTLRGACFLTEHIPLWLCVGGEHDDRRCRGRSRLVELSHPRVGREQTSNRGGDGRPPQQQRHRHCSLGRFFPFVLHEIWRTSIPPHRRDVNRRGRTRVHRRQRDTLPLCLLLDNLRLLSVHVRQRHPRPLPHSHSVLPPCMAPPTRQRP